MWFLTSDDLLWPRDTFLQKAESVILIYNLLYLIQVRNLTFFDIFDLEWPFMTLRHLSSESWRQERHFDIQFIPLYWGSKFDPKWPKIWNLTLNSYFFLEMFIQSHWTFWAISGSNLIEIRFLRNYFSKIGIFLNLTSFDLK